MPDHNRAAALSSSNGLSEPLGCPDHSCGQLEIENRSYRLKRFSTTTSVTRFWLWRTSAPGNSVDPSRHLATMSWPSRASVPMAFQAARPYTRASFSIFGTLYGVASADLKPPRDPKSSAKMFTLPNH